MDSTYCQKAPVTSKKIAWKRDEVCRLMHEFENVKHPCSQRQFSKENGVARTTLQHWLARKDAIDQSPVATAFFESPDGLAFIHRLITAAHLEFTKSGAASIHNVSNFLKMCGLSVFVASSYPSQRRIAFQMDEKIIAFEQDERERLAAKMPAKAITVCEDETFHPQICLVGTESVSNYILVEKYAEDRKTETWAEALDTAIKGLPVKIVQVASDLGSSLVRHALKSLKVHHSPDCFHVIYEIGKGTSVAMASKVKTARSEYEAKVKQAQQAIDRKEAYDTAQKRPRGRRPDFEKQIHSAQERAQKAEEDLKKSEENQETVRSSKAQIGQVYHPYNLKTGKKQDDRDVSQLLSDLFGSINNAAVGLSDKCRERVAKAKRVVKQMVATIAFFHFMVRQYLDNMNLSADDKELLEKYLIPGYYLRLAAGKQKDTYVRDGIHKKAQELLSVLENHDNGHVKSLDTARLKKAAKECAQLFQRSSSCVEGRNAQLSLRHQGIHRLSDRHLKALTVIHNYYIKRRDGTTAAERFFESKHRDLFDFLLENMDYPVRPRNYLRMAV